MSGLVRTFENFFFVRRDDLGLIALRIGLAVVILFYCVSLRRDWLDLYRSGGEGIISRDLTEAILNVESAWTPRLGWLVGVGQQAGLTESFVLGTIWWLLLSGASGLLIGIGTRTCAIVIWFLHLCSVKSGLLTSYGADNFVTIGLFYLMLAPLPDHLSADYRARNISLKSHRAFGLFQRVLQLHLSLIYLFGGVAKVFGSGWWNGDSIWRALTRPPFNVLSPQLLASWRDFFPLAGVAVCVLEAGYPIFIWYTRTRLVWFGAIITMHVVIGLAMRLYLFALIMIVLNIAAFGPELLQRCKDPRPQPGPRSSGQGNAFLSTRSLFRGKIEMRERQKCKATIRTGR